MTKGQAVISLPRGLSKILGFVVGYVFSSEVISGVTFLFGYTREQIPTLFDLLANYNTTVATILLVLLVILLLGIISKFQLLSFAVWLLYGALFGVVVPMVAPYVLERIEASGYNIPDFIKDLLGDISNGNGNNSTI